MQGVYYRSPNSRLDFSGIMIAVVSIATGEVGTGGNIKNSESCTYFAASRATAAKILEMFPPAWFLKSVRSDISLLLRKGLHGKFGGADVTANEACMGLSQMIPPCADRGSPELFLTFQLNGCSLPASQQRRQEGMRAGWV